MTTGGLTKFPAGSQDLGLSNFEPQISPTPSWDNTTVNVSSGMFRGVGPRFGVAPLAGHSNTEAPSGTATNGIMKSETSSGSQGLVNRKQIYGIVPITMAPYTGAWPKTNVQFYCYLVGLDDSTNICLDACLGSILSSSVNQQSSTIAAGLAQSSYREESPLVRRDKTELLNLPQNSTPTAADMKAILRQVASRYWLPYAHISISGKRVPYQWMLAKTQGTPDATHMPNMNLWTIPLTSGTSPSVYGGVWSESITRENTANNQRIFLSYMLDTSGYPLDMSYSASIDNSNINAVTQYADDDTYSVIGVTATKTGASVAYSSVKAAVVLDSSAYTNSKHDVVLMAGLTPFAIVYQDWLQAAEGMLPRWVDLTNPGCNPRPGVATTSLDGANTQASAFVNYGYLAVTGNKGVLQGSTYYDFGYSYYNKLLDYETNVAYGATILTSGVITDNTAICVGDLGAIYDSIYQQMVADPNAIVVPWDFSPASPVSAAKVKPRGMSINDYQIRFYYRESGTGEWLSAGNYDAAQFWFYGGWIDADGHKGPRICQSPQGGLPGGQPNGFVDYSPLPSQTYICSAVFQQRAFWWSERTMQFSYANNIYAYPTRNIITCPTGKWRGGIVHSQKDLSQQVSRIVVFGDNTYSARFTGNQTLQSVRVSADTVGQFAVDGSDFVMDYLCDSTAFSFRSAVVAEGHLFWWGPQGVYHDDGQSPPEKISQILEPDILDYVDLSRDSEVHCVYLKRTMEVMWFYPPKVADSTYPTHGLVYNLRSEEFYPFKMRCQVDSSQNVRIENDSSPDGVQGERILLHCRATTSDTVSRTFYFDDLVKAGQQYPGAEFTVLTVATPATGTRRLTLAAGSVGITTGGVAVNDLICIQNAKGYAPALSTATDMIAKITAVNNGSSYIDILLPTGGDISTASLDGQTAFPIYQCKSNFSAAGLHGITYQVATNYWIPTGGDKPYQASGMSEAYLWMYLYFLFRYTGIPTPTNPLTNLPTGAQTALSYRTPAGGGYATDTLSLTNNSDTNCQIHHPMRNENLAAAGQALKYRLSGIHIGNPWTLEYLEAHCQLISGFTLKQFEG